MAGAKVAAYVHYPTISTDMLTRVQNREAGHTNSADISDSLLLSGAKLGYYYALVALYGAVGGWANVSGQTSRMCCHGFAPCVGCILRVHPTVEGC